MEGERVQDRRTCPHCEGASVRKNGKNRGKQRWHCRECGKSFGETFGTPMFGLHTPVEEVARTLLIVMRRGSLRAAEEISGHKHETIGEWLRRAGAHAEALTEVLVRDLELDEVEVDAFWSFVGNATETLQRRQPRHRGWPKQAIQERAGAG
jgi:transposase-like protein